jgi:hypothetical protein
LVELDVRGTRITKAAVAALARAVPRGAIEHDHGVVEPKK